MKLIIEPGPHSIAAARLVRRRSPLSRLDGWPWLLLHAVAYAVAVNPSVEGVLESFSLPIILATSVAAHVLCILGQFWSVSWFFLVRFEAATSLADADSVFVEPLPHAGSTEIVPLLRQAPTGDAQVLSAGAKAGAPQPPLSGAWLGVAQLAFSYQSCLYDVIPCGDALTVSRLVLPDACPLGAYQAWQGWRAHECEAAAAKWGANSIVMPSPTFAELMAEAVLAPLFVFQVQRGEEGEDASAVLATTPHPVCQIACVLLWALDDYWYYSLFSLFTLFSLEAVMVGSRMKQRSGLRAVRARRRPVPPKRWELPCMRRRCARRRRARSSSVTAAGRLPRARASFPATSSRSPARRMTPRRRRRHHRQSMARGPSSLGRLPQQPRRARCVPQTCSSCEAQPS